jgi:hypothetical protein
LIGVYTTQDLVPLGQEISKLPNLEHTLYGGDGFNWYQSIWHGSDTSWCTQKALADIQQHYQQVQKLIQSANTLLQGQSFGQINDQKVTELLQQVEQLKAQFNAGKPSSQQIVAFNQLLRTTFQDALSQVRAIGSKVAGDAEHARAEVFNLAQYAIATVNGAINSAVMSAAA